MNEQLREIQDANLSGAILGRVKTELEGFTALTDPNNELVWLNYAVPISSCCVSSDAIHELVAHFVSLSRTPRLEFFDDLWPGLTYALESHGFERQARQPMLVMTAEVWKGIEPTLRTEQLLPHGDVESYVAIGFSAFGGGIPTIEDFERTRKQIESGSMCAMVAYWNDEPIASGCSIGTDKIRELAGIATLEAHRRKGAATAVNTALLNTHFDNGGKIAWLTSGDDAARQCYEKMGFEQIAWQENWWRSTPS